MTTAPTNTVPASRSINNLADSNRKWPVEDLAQRVLTAAEGVVLQILPGTNATPIQLNEKITPGTIVLVLAFVTASGAPAARTYLRQDIDFTVDPNVAGQGEITPAGDESANTLIIAYSPDLPDGTIGGQSSVIVTDQATNQP